MNEGRDIPVVILAGGLGTRLRSVAPDTPKPLVEVAGKPFLVWQLQWLRRQGFCNIILSIGYRADDFVRVLGDGTEVGVRIRYSREETPLGTGGALRLASRLIEGDTAIVQNGDTFCDIDLAVAVSSHEVGNVRATMVVAEVPDTARFGRVTFDAGFAIQAFHEKGSYSGKGFINAGTYILSREVIHEIPVGASSLERDLFPRLCARPGFVAHPVQAPMIDIGTPESLLAARSDFARPMALTR